MKHYTTLNNATYDLERLSDSHRRFVEKMVSSYKTKPHWNKFSNYWIREGKNVWKEMTRKEAVNHPTFKICQDLESRLGIEQGYVRKKQA